MTSYVFFVCFFNHCFLQKFLYLYNNVWRHLWTTLNDLLDKEDGECLKINGSNTKLLIVSALIGPDCVAALGGPLYSNGLLRQFSQMMRIHFPTYSLKHFQHFLTKYWLSNFSNPFEQSPIAWVQDRPLEQKMSFSFTNKIMPCSTSQLN